MIVQLPISPLDCNLCYILTVKVEDMTTGEFKFKVKYAGFLNSEVGTVSADGTHTLKFEVDCIDLKGGIFGENLAWDILEVEKTGDGTLEIVSLVLDPDCYEVYCSEPICLPEKICDQVVAMIWGNDKPAFGFQYPPGFLFSAIFRGDIMHEQPEYEVERFKTAHGKKINTRADLDRSETLLVVQQPLYMHQAIQVGLIHDNVYINGVQYVMGGRSSYDIDHETIVSGLKNAETEIEKNPLHLRNKSC